MMRISMQDETLPHAGVKMFARVFLDGEDVTQQGVVMADEERGEIERYARLADSTFVTRGSSDGRTPVTETVHGAVRIEMQDGAPAASVACYDQIRAAEAASAGDTGAPAA